MAPRSHEAAVQRRHYGSGYFVHGVSLVRESKSLQAYLQELEGAECRGKKPALEIRVKPHGLAGSEKGKTQRAKRSTRSTSATKEEA